MKTCSRCATLAAKVKTFRDSFKFGPAVQSPNADMIHLRILHRARMISMPPRPSWTMVFFTPKVRFALGAVIAFFVCLFFVQESIIMMSIVRLENKVSTRNQAALTPYAISKKIFYRPLPEKDGNQTLDDYVIIKKSTLQKIFQLYENAEIYNHRLFDYIEDQSKLYNINLQDGLDMNELLILEKKQDILKDYYNL